MKHKELNIYKNNTANKSWNKLLSRIGCNGYLKLVSYCRQYCHIFLKYRIQHCKNWLHKWLWQCGCTVSSCDEIIFVSDCAPTVTPLEGIKNDWISTFMQIFSIFLSLFISHTLSIPLYIYFLFSLSLFLYFSLISFDLNFYF